MSIALVNSVAASNAASASSLQTGALSVTPGNLIVVVTSIGLGTDTVSSVTDDLGGNVYQKAVGINGVIAADLEIWYGVAVNGGSLKWTAAWGTAGVNRRVLVLQYSGGVGPLDQTNTNSAAVGATTLTTGAVTTTLADELLIAAFTYLVAQTPTGGNSFVVEVSTPATPDTAAADRIVTSTGSYTGQVTVGTGTGYLGAIATFKMPGDVVAKLGGRFTVKVQ